MGVFFASYLRHSQTSWNSPNIQNSIRCRVKVINVGLIRPKAILEFYFIADECECSFFFISNSERYKNPAK